MPDVGSSLDYFKRNGLPIIAEATAVGGPVSILRLSGVDLNPFKKLVGNNFPSPKEASYRDVAGVDRALVLYFKAPNSFTGEDVLEIQGHGIRSFVESIISKAEQLGAIRALPGEFTFRAFLNEKISLSQAELLNESFCTERVDVLSARQMLGFSKKENKFAKANFNSFQEQVFQARGRVESAIDFPEAEAEQSQDVDTAKLQLEQLKKATQEYISFYENFARQYSYPLIGIIGETNSGKSTLFNLLCGNNRSIVSDVAGTTRDYVEAKLKRGKIEFKLLDTAGLRELTNELDHNKLENKGIELGLDALEKSELLFWVKKCGVEDSSFIKQKLSKLNKKVIEIYSHADLVLSPEKNAFNFLDSDSSALKSFIYSNIEDFFNKERQIDSELVISTRQYRHLQELLSHVETALSYLDNEGPLEIVAQELQKVESLIKLCQGKELGEEYIGAIFSQFCLGK